MSISCTISSVLACSFAWSCWVDIAESRTRETGAAERTSPIAG